MKLCRRILSTMLALSLVLALLPVNVWAADDTSTSGFKAILDEVEGIESGVNSDLNANSSMPTDKIKETDETAGDSLTAVPNACGDSLTWSLENGALLISGTGPMFDYTWHVSEDLREYLDTPWFSQREDITQIIVSDGVTAIGANAFSACYNVSDVTIADSVTSIGEGAFDGCGATEELMPIADDINPVAVDNTTGNVRYSVVVLDVSGSMGSQPMTAQKAAAIKFCESLLAADGSNYVAVVSFGSSVRIVSQFSQDINALKSAINGIRASGVTNTIGALKKADELLSSIPETAGRSIVLCTDGLPNEGEHTTNGPFSSSDSSSYYDYANAVYNKSIELMQKYDIFTLGFFHSLRGTDLTFAQKFMPSIQNAGYYEVTDPEDLEFTFGDIAGDVVTPGHSGVILVTVPKDKYVIHVVNEAGRNLQGVEVTCNGTSARTNNNGLAQFDRSLFVSTPRITAKAGGYIDWSNEHSNWEFDIRGYTTIKMYPTSASQYKLSECVYSNVPGNVSPGVNLLTRTKTISLGNDLPVAGDLDLGNFYLTCKAIKTDGVTEYQLWQSSKQIKTCTDGNFGQLSVDTDGFIEGGKCFIRVITADGERVDTNINLQFEKHDINDVTEISFMGGGKPGEDGKLSFKVGDNVPFIGGSTFDFDMPISAPVTFLVEDGGQKVQIGFNLADITGTGEKDAKKKQFEDLKKLLTDTRTAANLKVGKLDNQQKKIFYSLLKGNNKKWKFFKDGEINFLGYVEGDFSNSTLKGHVMLQGQIKAAEFGFTTWVVVVPVTIQVGLDLEGNLIGEIGYDWANAQLIGSLDFDASAKLTAFGGVGVGKAIGAGAYGSAELGGEIRIIGAPWGLRSVDLTGELGVKAYIAWFTYERPFAKNTWHLYTGNNVRAFSMDEPYTPSLDPIYDVDNYQTHDLGYLSEESEWMGTPMMLFDASAATQLAALQTDTYRNAQPMMVAADDALYAAFLKADPNSGNVYVAVTKFDGAQWSEPVRIDNDAVMDGTPSLCVGNDGTIWLAYAKTAAGHSNTNLLDYAQHQSIVVGSLDTSTLTFTEKTVYSDTNTGSYARLQQLALVNNVPTLVWAESTVTDDNSVLWPLASELYMASYDGSGWTAAQKLTSVDKPVLQVIAGAQGGVSGAAYVVDTDGSPLTTEDCSLYFSNSADTPLATNVQGKVIYDVLPSQGQGADFMWNAENCLKTAGGVEIAAEGITREYAISGNRIYYSSAGEKGAQLTTVIHDNGSWSTPVTLTGGERYLENVSAVTLNSNDYVMGMDTLATITNENVTDAKNLVWGQIMPTSNLRIDGVDYETGGLTVGTSVPVALTVVNAGDHAVSSVDIIINGQSETRQCSIAPGESTDITVTVICPAVLTQYNFAISESNQTDFTPEDNTVSVGIGYADLEVKVEEERIEDQSSLVVYLANRGVASATGTIIISDASGNQVNTTPFADLAAGNTFVVSYPMQNSGVYTATAALADNAADLYAYNNSDTTGIGNWSRSATYVITFNANGGTVNPTTMNTDAQGRLASLPVPSQAGYRFDGWFTALSGGTQITETYEFSGNATAYARWTYVGAGSSTPDYPYNPGGYWTPTSTPTTYSITVSSVNGGTITASPKSAASGKTITLTATPDAGYELTSLSVIQTNGTQVSLTNAGNNQYTFTMPSGKVTVNSVFNPIWNNPFVDVAENAWYYDAVKFVSKNGLMNGIGNGQFAPENHLSRAMLAQILYNKEGRPATIGNRTFADVAFGAWYADAVRWASEKGIVAGYGDNLFGPDSDITREQFAVMLYRYAGSPVPPNLALDFVDANKISDWARDAVCWAVDQGILNGKGNGILDPAGKATRAEAAQMLKNYLDK